MSSLTFYGTSHNKHICLECESWLGQGWWWTCFQNATDLLALTSFFKVMPRVQLYAVYCTSSLTNVVHKFQIQPPLFRVSVAAFSSMQDVLLYTLIKATIVGIVYLDMLDNFPICFQVLLTNKLDGDINMTYTGIVTPLFVSFTTLILMSFSAKGGNKCKQQCFILPLF